MIRPSDRRDLLERVNVEGARRVAEAVAAAGVSHLEVASSVGAYSPDQAREALREEGSSPPPRDEKALIPPIRAWIRQCRRMCSMSLKLNTRRSSGISWGGLFLRSC